MEENKLSKYLIDHDFKLQKELTSKSFGDYSKTYVNGSIGIIFGRSRSDFYMDIYYKKDKEAYDMALVKALINNESNLNVKTTFLEYLNFFQSNFDRILLLFDRNEYNTTKESLEKLQMKRALQMFPNISFE